MFNTTNRALYVPKHAYSVTPLAKTIARSTEKGIVIVDPTKYSTGLPIPFYSIDATLQYNQADDLDRAEPRRGSLQHRND
jgi:hypothetical protein